MKKKENCELEDIQTTNDEHEILLVAKKLIDKHEIYLEEKIGEKTIKVCYDESNQPMILVEQNDSLANTLYLIGSSNNLLKINYDYREFIIKGDKYSDLEIDEIYELRKNKFILAMRPNRAKNIGSLMAYESLKNDTKNKIAYFENKKLEQEQKQSQPI